MGVHNCKDTKRRYINIAASGTAGGMGLLLNRASAQATTNDMADFRQVDNLRWQVQSDGALRFTDAADVERIVAPHLFLVDNDLLYLHESLLDSEDEDASLLLILPGFAVLRPTENRVEAEPLSADLAVGSLARGALGFDTRIIVLSTYFETELPPTFSIIDGDIPDGFTFDASSGVLVLNDVSAPIGAGDHIIMVRAEDTDGQILVQKVTLVVALRHVFGDNYARGDESISGSSEPDILIFGVNTAGTDGRLNIDTGDGNDVLVFSDNAGNGGTLGIITGRGNDLLIFADNAGSGADGNLDIDTGDGDDTLEFGAVAGSSSGNVTIDTGHGDDELVFGDGAASNLGIVDVKTGDGNDTVTVGDNADAGRLTIDLGDDDSVDSVVFSPFGAGGFENVSIRNWTMGIDSKVDVANIDTWTGVSNGDNVVFTGNGSIVFEGIASTVASLDVADFLM